MRIGRLGEFGAVELVKSLCNMPGREVRVGIGDDAASFVPGKGQILASADMMVEGVHFDLGYAGFADLGYKALASNLSDIAAMGGTPRYCMVSVALTGREDVKDIEALYLGMEEAAAPHGVRLIGGDTVGSPGPVVVSVTILGEAGPKGPVRRSTAKPGDDIYVTGTLGDSAAGLALLQAGRWGKVAGKGGAAGGRGQGGKSADSGYASYLVSRHLRPRARVEAGMLLGAAGFATSMIDVSDGFSSDLGHILEGSGAGAEVEEARLPVSDALVSVYGRKKAVSLALSGGEDYELVFTARPGHGKRVAAIFDNTGAGITVVGRITGQKGAYLLSAGGARKPLLPRGYEHFRK
ncbi:MAG TPA: thiamine-phosphate kinase [Nitrospirota bacterium]